MSEHFSAKEFYCHCGCCPENPEFKVSPILLYKLEQLRALLGNIPIKINSGFRCEKHNKDIGGAKNSYHMIGYAADIFVGTKTPDEVAAAAEQVGFGGIGIYSSWVHVDVRSMVLKARWKNV